MKHTQLISLECTNCRCNFNKLHREYKHCIKKNANYTPFCSSNCYKLFHSNNRTAIECNNCKKSITKTKSQLMNGKRFYCSRSCAAIKNNKSRAKHDQVKCQYCNNMINWHYKYCSDCISKEIHRYGCLPEEVFKQPIKNFIYEASSRSNKFQKIRLHAVKVMEDNEQICQKCGYSKHVEVCHIKPLHTFDIETPLNIVNDKSNLILLCPNCHWEMDNIKSGRQDLNP